MAKSIGSLTLPQGSLVTRTSQLENDSRFSSVYAYRWQADTHSA